MPVLDSSQEGRGITPAQINRLYAIAQSCFVSSVEVHELLEQVGVVDPRDLNRQQYDDLIGAIQAMDMPSEGRATDPQTGEIYEDEQEF